MGMELLPFSPPLRERGGGLEEQGEGVLIGREGRAIGRRRASPEVAVEEEGIAEEAATDEGAEHCDAEGVVLGGAAVKDTASVAEGRGGGGERGDEAGEEGEVRVEEAMAEEEGVDLEERREARGGAAEEGEADPLFAGPEAIREGSYSSGGEDRGGGGGGHGRRLSCRRGSTLVGKREREYLKRDIKLPN